MNTIELLCVLLAGAVVALLYTLTMHMEKLAKERGKNEELWRSVQGLVDGTWGLRVEKDGTTMTLFRKRQAPRDVNVSAERGIRNEKDQSL